MVDLEGLTEGKLARTGPSCDLGWVDNTKEAFASSPAPRLRFFETEVEAILLHTGKVTAATLQSEVWNHCELYIRLGAARPATAVDVA